MSAENETIADIAAELRQDYKGRPPINRAETTWCRRLIADRIEAAYKREVEKLNSVIQATVSRSDSEIDRLRREVAELKKQISNAAKMREALENCANMGEQIDCQLGSSDATVYAFRHERCLAHNISECARAALAAPARNCDLYADEAEARAAFIAEKCEHPCGNCTVRKDDALCHPCGIEWLFAIAKNGGDK